MHIYVYIQLFVTSNVLGNFTKTLRATAKSLGAKILQSATSSKLANVSSPVVSTLTTAAPSAIPTTATTQKPTNAVKIWTNWAMAILIIFGGLIVLLLVMVTANIYLTALPFFLVSLR